jgi:hypothetical protein
VLLSSRGKESLTRAQRLVPLGTDLTVFQVGLLHLCLGILLTFGILPFQQGCPHRQTRPGGPTKVTANQLLLRGVHTDAGPASRLKTLLLDLDLFELQMTLRMRRARFLVFHLHALRVAQLAQQSAHGW